MASTSASFREWGQRQQQQQVKKELFMLHFTVAVGPFLDVARNDGGDLATVSSLDPLSPSGHSVAHKSGDSGVSGAERYQELFRRFSHRLEWAERPARERLERNLASFNLRGILSRNIYLLGGGLKKVSRRLTKS